MHQRTVDGEHGHLGREEGYGGAPHGLDLIGSLAALARQRLPHWSERVFVGNVMDWRAPFRFDFVRTELEYAPPNRRREMVERLLREYLSPGGRLILCSYGSSRRSTPRAEPVGEILRNWGYTVAGETEGVDKNGVVFTRIAWTDLPETCHSIVSDTILSPASLSGTQ